MPADMNLSTSPADAGFMAHHGSGIDSNLPIYGGNLETSAESERGIHHIADSHGDFDSVKSPNEAHLSFSPDFVSPGITGSAQFSANMDHEYAVQHQSPESPASKSQTLPEYEASKSPGDMDFALPTSGGAQHEPFDTSMLSRSQELSRSPETGFLPSNLGDYTKDVTGFQEPSHPHPQTTTADDEFPVHEISVGGGKVIPEVTDQVELSDYPPDNMPPIHGDLMYQLQKECTSQPADSTTYDGPPIGFMDVTSGRPVEEIVHSPSSEVSNGSVIHTEAAPIPPGFIPEAVSSSFPTATATSPNSGAPSGFSSQHPLLYSQHQPEVYEGDNEAVGEAETDPSFHQKSPTTTLAGTGDMEVPFSKSPASPHRDEANGFEAGDFTKGTDPSEKPAGGTDSSGTVPFDPLTQWGHPQGMPAPVMPSRTTLGRSSRPTTARSSTLGTKASTPSTTSKAPETLPPGSPIHLDVIWVPGYIIRVPFAMAMQFFTQVRARIYVLSGECLHPITGEALIAGISRWKPEEREAVMKMSGGRGVEGINVVPTDEPLEWVRWLRRSSGGSGDGSGTGEERLQAVGVTIHSSATLCDIHFSDNGTEITCPGTQLPV
ncbi:unnamed protein product [Hydatigera taeniaeformis]|uniref:BRCT domain-containing protein n=1 Tax=Hydatigena taeniaeformis TaxID=6205 RepID=A0A0R3XC49_HYDTA|nr:unnamed protein product [Hydatigera taeniaeformis]